MMDSWRIPEAGAWYIPETKAKCYWEIAIVSPTKVRLIQRGGPAGITALTIEHLDGEGLVITDCWDWGDG